MRNPIHKRLANLNSWQHHVFMLCLCEEMYGNFVFFCQHSDNLASAKVYRSILNVLWEHLTIKNSKINLERQLEKLESIIPNSEGDTEGEEVIYAIYPAIDACRGLADAIHSFIAGETLNFAISISQLNFKTIIDLLEAETGETLSEAELKEQELITQELDLQWEIYRALKDEEKFNLELIQGLKQEIKQITTTNIGIEV